MNRKKFIGYTGGLAAVAAGIYYLGSDRQNITRSNLKVQSIKKANITAEERSILWLASLAPSGHNTQPWFIKYNAPFHWIICNDKSKWLPAVDPHQRETILSIGAFIQTLEYAAAYFGYACELTINAGNNQDENIATVHLYKNENVEPYDVEKIKNRRTIRSGFTREVLREVDLAFLTQEEPTLLHYLPGNETAAEWLNDQTIIANRLQSYRDEAQKELANWIRFSRKEAERFQDGLTPAGMEIAGIQGWVLRNFYTKQDVLKKSFREDAINKIKDQVAHSGGWMVITSTDNSLTALLDTGKRLQRLLLKIRERNIAMHPMTQLLEESTMNHSVNAATGLTAPIQFLLRTGYIKSYPAPVSLRRPVDTFIRL